MKNCRSEPGKHARMPYKGPMLSTYMAKHKINMYKAMVQEYLTDGFIVSFATKLHCYDDIENRSVGRLRSIVCLVSLSKESRYSKRESRILVYLWDFIISEPRYSNAGSFSLRCLKSFIENLEGSSTFLIDSSKPGSQRSPSESLSSGISGMAFISRPLHCKAFLLSTKLILLRIHSSMKMSRASLHPKNKLGI